MDDSYAQVYQGKQDKSHVLVLQLQFGRYGRGLVLDDFTTWDEEKYGFVKEVLWQQNGKLVGLDHDIPLGSNGITL